MTQAEDPIMLKQWHLIVTAITWTLLAGMAFASLRAQSEENERRINELEQKPSVSLQQYQDGQRNTEQRLIRIESKIDSEQEKRH